MERDLKCMYCAEMGITNTDVFIEIVDVELGAGWICKECFIESEKEKDEHLKELEEELQAKEQECEELNKELHKNFKEKDTLHLIIDRLLEASGYDTNAATAEDFEDVYEHMRYEQQQLDQLKAENEELKRQYKELGQCSKGLKDYYEKEKETLSNRFLKLKQTLTEIKEIAEVEIECKTYEVENDCFNETRCKALNEHIGFLKQILQKISEVEE